MIEVLLLLLASADRFVATPPERILMVVLAPPQLAISSADVLESAEEAFRSIAHVTVVSPEQMGVPASGFDACPVEVRSSCWVRTALGASGEDPRVLIMVSMQGAHRVTIVSFDLRDAERDLRAGEDKDEEALEQRIWDRAIRSAPDTSGDLGLLFSRQIRAELGELLTTIAPLSAYGSVEVQGIDPGAELALDGTSLGVVTATVARMDAVPIGEHRVRMISGGASSEREVLVEAGRSSIVDVTLAPSFHPIRFASIIAGSVALIAGTSAMIAALAGGRTPRLCIHRSDPNDCLDPPDALAYPSRPALAIGVGLVAAAASWGAGAAIFEDDSIWWSVAIGFALGGAAAGLTYALD